MAATFKQDKKLAEIAEKVLKEKENLAHLMDERCRIAYQYSDEEKKSRNKIVYADTEKVKDKLKSIIPYDFVITFYQPNTANLTEDKMKKLMYHELRHVGFDVKKGTFSIIPHEVEDFREIIDSWGIDWIDSK